jgi:hypothetical protein
MFIAAFTTVWKISRGSKSGFAYLLMAFTIGNGCTNLGFYLTDALRTPRVLGKTTYHFANFTAVSIVGYSYYLMSLQTWIFGFRYLDSAINSSS